MTNQPGRAVPNLLPVARVALAAFMLAGSLRQAVANPICLSGSRLQGVTDHVARTTDRETATTVLRRLTTARRSCTTCHIGSGAWFLVPNTPPRWPLNAYGNALTILQAVTPDAFTSLDRLPVDPTDPDGPTFGDRIRQGLPPWPLFPAEDYEEAAAAAAGVAREPATLNFKEAIGTVLAARGPVLQVSEVAAVDARTAGALARFNGSILLLGLRSLPADVARRLAASEADTVWLHSLTVVEPEAAAALANLRADLVMTGLERLESVELAAKLAARPGRLSLPCLRLISPAAAAALVARTDAVVLESLADVTAETQAALAKAQGPLHLPSLRRLESPALARVLAALPNVQLGGLEALPAEMAVILVEPARFREGLELPVDVLTAEVLDVFAAKPVAVGRLTVLGREVSADRLRAIAGLAVKGTLFAEVVDPSAELAEAAAECQAIFPNLRRLDSAKLATAVTQRGDPFRITCLESVREISPAAATEISKLEPSGALPLASLARLPVEVAGPLLATPRIAVSLPVLEEIATASLARLLEQILGEGKPPPGAGLTLGVSRLPSGPFAAPAAGGPGGTRFDLTLPALATLSAADARNLVAAVRPGSDFLFIGVPELSPEAASILAAWPGRLTIAGLKTLSPQVVAALAGCSEKTSLLLDGITMLDAEAAEKLAEGKAGYSLKGLTTLTPDLAAALARGRKWGLLLPAVRAIDAATAAELVKGLLVGLPGLKSLEPDVAALLVSCPTWDPRLDGLTTITPETAAALAKYQGPLELSLTGLTTLDAASARALAACPRWRPMLQNLRSLDAETAAVLATCKGQVALSSLVTITPEAAAALVPCPGPVSIKGLKRLTPEAAAALVRCPTWDGRLAGIVSFDAADSVAVAKALAEREGALSLPNLRRISPRTLVALAVKGDAEIPPLKTLTLIAEPDGSPADDFVLPEELRDR